MKKGQSFRACSNSDLRVCYLFQRRILYSENFRWVMHFTVKYPALKCVPSLWRGDGSAMHDVDVKFWFLKILLFPVRLLDSVTESSPPTRVEICPMRCSLLLTD